MNFPLIDKIDQIRIKQGEKVLKKPLQEKELERLKRLRKELKDLYANLEKNIGVVFAKLEHLSQKRNKLLLILKNMEKKIKELEEKE